MSFPPNERLRKGMVIHMYIPETDRDDGGILKGITCFALDMDGTVYLGLRELGIFLQPWSRPEKSMCF